MTPAGLLHVGRGHLRRVTVIYLLLAGIAIAVPAALAQPRGSSGHLTSERTER
ncbi:MAG: hypothetical protein IPQ07_03750 [Myxococcales bacterium]|nr:hypothetical protein [Myxococcales bacterium]